MHFATYALRVDIYYEFSKTLSQSASLISFRNGYNDVTVSRPPTGYAGITVDYNYMCQGEHGRDILYYTSRNKHIMFT